ncbi:PAS domain S-box protein [Novosphingobium panipatense]|uniref:PAS domain S-box protein n=1 Tax=Novosphingobium panipatense TaxID=428991 RepID=UPI00361C44B4
MAANDATHVDAEHGLKKRGALGAADRLSAIIESSDDVIIGKTLDGIITDWNAGAERVFGYAPEEIMGASILTLIPQDRRAEEDEIIARLKNGERSRISRPCGSARTVASSIFPLPYLQSGQRTVW